MSTLHQARVYETLPARHGVLVVFRDGSYTVDGEHTFVRVLVPRAHNHHGACISLPQPGENGIVAELDGGMMVWMGSFHIQDANQIDPDPGLAMVRTDAGTMRRERLNGDAEWLHPSGLRFTVSLDGKALPTPKRTGNGLAKAADAPHVVLAHPSGGEIRIAPDGAMEIKGFKSIKILDGAKRFVMEPLKDWMQNTLKPWLENHTHPGVMSGSASTSKPASGPGDIPDDALSPTTLTGPVDG